MPSKITCHNEEIHDIENLFHTVNEIDAQQQYDDVTLVKVPGGVYDVFLMVGFENLIKIERLG